MKVRIHIERVVLDGLNVAGADPGFIQAALETELSRLVTGGGIHPTLASGGAFAGVRGGGLEFTPETKPAALGSKIARAAYQGFGK